jgi:hypothetical protein
MRRALFAGLLAVALGLGSAAAADDPIDAAALMAQLKGEVAQLKDITRQREGLISDNERDLRTAKLMQDSHDRLKVQLEAQVAAKKAEIDKRREGANALANAFNAQCGGKELPEAAYAACDEKKAQLEPIIAVQRKKADDDAAEFLKAVIEPNLKIINQQTQGVEQIHARVRTRIDQTDKLEVTARRLKASIEKARTQLASVCKERPSQEQPAYCGSIGWDGTKQGLLPLDKVMPEL